MNRHGVTLIELMMTMVIGAIAFFALSVPFTAERTFWGAGNRQTEAQRDAQMVLRTIARTGRQSTGYNAALARFNVACGTESYAATNGQLTLTKCAGGTVTLIDGVKSRVAAFSITPVGTKLVDVRIQITRQGGVENEDLRSQIFMRNAP